MIEEYLKQDTQFYHHGIIKVYLLFIPVVVVVSQEMASIMFKISTLDKPFFFEAAHPFIKGLGNINGDEFRYRKKLLGPAFRSNLVQERISRQFKVLEEDMLQKSQDTFQFEDMLLATKRLSEALTLDSLGFTEYKEFKQESVERMYSAYQIESFTTKPWYLPWTFINLLPPTKDGLKTRKADKFFGDFLTDLLTKTKIMMENNSSQVSTSFMQLLLKEHDTNPKQMTMNEVLKESKFLYTVSGLGSLGLVSMWILHEVGHRQDVQERIIKELQENVDIEHLENQDFSQLKYLKAVIREGLRKHATGPLAFRQASQEIKLEEKQMIIPKGSIIILDLNNINMNPFDFKDPEVFNPDRFLENKTQTTATFSGGHRSCPGINVAMASLQGILVRIFLKYRLKSLNPLSSIQEQRNVLLYPLEKCEMQFILRK